MKILDEAVALAEAGGFENVRQRDVASNAGVALGTLYKRYRSKEHILVAALERDTEELERRMGLHPCPGRTPLERITAFFVIVTRGLCRRPKYARAILRSVISGEEGVAKNVASYQGRIAGLIIAAIRGVGRLNFQDAATPPPTRDELRLATPLQQIWFAALVGWSSGLLKQSEVVEQVTESAKLLLRGLEGEP